MNKTVLITGASSGLGKDFATLFAEKGYDLVLTEKVSSAVNIPVIASGGAGSLDDIFEAFVKGKASAALLASLLHDKKLTIKQIKSYLLEKNLIMRPYE